MMNPFFCLQCSRTSFLDERFRCIHCGNSARPRTVVADNFDHPVPEPEDASPGYNVTATNEGNQMSGEYFTQVEQTQEVNNQMFEETSNLSFQIIESHSYEHRLRSDGPSQYQFTHDFDQYQIANQNSLLSNTNTNEGEFYNQSYDICNAETSLELTHDKLAASQQTYFCKQSSVEDEIKNSSDELLRRQGTEEPTEHAITSNNFVLTDSLTLDSEYPVVSLFSDSSNDINDKQDKDHIPQSTSYFSRKNTTVNKCFEGNSVTAKKVARKKPQTSSKFLKRRCGKCGRFFFKEWTFYAHLQNYCNQRKPLKCVDCGEIFLHITALLQHQRVHTREKPFKCTQCDYSFAWSQDLKKHLKMHANIPPSSSFPRRNTPVNKSLQKNLLTLKTLQQKSLQSAYKFKTTKCKNCNRFFRKLSTFTAHVESNCHPRPFKCGQCGDRFAKMNYLIQHGKVHTEEKPFKCDHCDYATKWTKNLKTHLKTHQSKECIP